MSFPRYENYKDSGIEWLEDMPKHWSVKKIKYLLKNDGYKAGPFGSSLITSELADEGDILVITPEHIANESLSLPFNQYLKESRRGEMSAFFVDINDVIFPIVGTLGRAMIIYEPRPGILNQRLARLSPDIEKLLPKYLKLILTDVDFYKKLDDVESKGAILSHITKEKIINRPLLLPPIAEQQCILSFLDRETAKIDALIAEQQRLIELLKEKRQAVISHAVTKGLNPDAPMKDSGIEWLGEVPEHWEVKATKRLFQLVVESAPDNNDYELLSIYTEIGVRPRKELEAKGNKATTTDGYWMVKKGDLIVNKLLAWMGAIGISDYDGVTSPAYDILRQRIPLEPRYYDFLFRCGICFSEFRRYSRGIMDMRLRLYFDELGQLYMPYPSKAEQSEIVKFLESELDKFDPLIAEAQLAISLLQERRTALISAAVTGKIDVRGLVSDKQDEEQAA
jgi:type I restriction enzyme, S subunit